MRILIAGAGIAGLTAALSLHAAGHRDITVYERSADLHPLGSGLNLMPQATRCFDALGVLDSLRGVSVATSTMMLATSAGQILWSERRNDGSAPQLSVHRGWLTTTLAEHVAQRLGPAAVRTGVRLIDVDPAARAALVAANGDRTTEPFDVFVGADGIRSAARSSIVGTDVPLRYGGTTVWRGMTRFRSFADDKTMVIAGDGISKVVLYPLTAPDGSGTVLMNWAAATPESHGLGEKGNWNVPATPDQFVPNFRGWNIADIDIAELMTDTAAPFAYPMVDIDPLDRWTAGDSTVLIGDAAHAMYPVGSNGATQSVVDAYLLAQHLTFGAPPGPALRAFEKTRRPATRDVQLANRAKGPEIAIDLAAQRAPNGFDDLAEVFAPGELEAIARGYAQISGARTATRI